MKRVFVMAIIATFCSVGLLQGDVLYQVTGTLSANGGDSEQLNGATLTADLVFDNTATYVDSFGFPTTDATAASVTISGSVFNDGTTSYNGVLTFFPTFAGTFADGGAAHTEFNTLGGGALMQFQMNTTPTPGAANAVIGGLVELDDFAPGASWGGGLLINLNTGDNYSYNNVSITATKSAIPEPSSAALIAIGLVGTLLRRRRAA